MIEVKGRLKLHSSTPSVNTTVGTEVAGDIAATQNTPEYLQKSFFTESPKHILINKLPSGGQVAVLHPSGPYSENAFLVIAAGPNSLEQNRGNTEFIYDYPEDVQEEYWRATLTILNSFKESSNPEKEIAVAVENAVGERTSKHKRTSRSISLPHNQVILLELDQIEKHDWHFSHLDREQRVLRFKAITRLIQEKLHEMASPEMIDVFKTVTQRENAPYGYSFRIPISFETSQIAQVMKAHHVAYASAANEVVSKLKPANQESIIPQPSYRVYITQETDALEVTISPEFMSHAGVLEAANILLDRSPDHKRVNSSEHFEQLNETISAALTARR